MRHNSIALFGVLAFAAGTFAQQAPPPVGTPEQLSAHLAQWEREMSAVKSISAECKRTDVNLVKNNKVELAGLVKCLKIESAGGRVDKLALLQLGPVGKLENFTEKYICTGDYLYRFAPADRVIWVHKLKGQLSDDNFLDFVFQLKAETMKKRYDITLAMPDDPNYIYFDLKPRLEADKVEFERARLVLLKKNYLPAQLWFKEPNGNYHTWDLSKVKGNDPEVKPKEFTAPEVPTGWKLKEAKETQIEAPPRVIRPAPNK